jgi:hypothetical protein
VNREVEVGEKTYRISIGFGAYQRISALNVFLRAMNPDFEQEIDTAEASQGDIEKATEVATAALRSEELITKEEEAELQTLADLGGGLDLIDLLGAEQKLQEKIHESKVRILEIAVRDASSNEFLSRDYVEYDLSPAHGEELFATVMETFELIESEIKDVKRKKKS